MHVSLQSVHVRLRAPLEHKCASMRVCVECPVCAYVYQTCIVLRVMYERSPHYCVFVLASHVLHPYFEEALNESSSMSVYWFTELHNI